MKKRDLAFLKGFVKKRKKPDGEIFSMLDDFDFLKEDIPNEPGAYILLSFKSRFIYPEGTSKVIYIGMSKKLKKRLTGHYNALVEVSGKKINEKRNFWYYSRYNYLDRFGCRVYWFKCKNSETPKELESILMDAFYSKYHSLPVGNGAFSF